jgi:hypothetical protein
MIAPSRFLPALLLLLVASPTFAEDEDKRPAAALQDNSFLIEEAYNQEEGVVQHILNVRRLRNDWLATFTQEWPIYGETHQLSYTLPYSWVGTDDGRHHGFGDLMLNYRLQLLEETDSQPAVAPRVSAILPTGSEARGLGAGTAGWQFALPVSKIIADRWTVHGNADMTVFPNSHGRAPASYLLGASTVYAVTPDLNLMLEGLREWNASAEEGGTIERERRWTVSPGFRHAFNLEAGQLVWGAAVPIGVQDGHSTDYGLFFYLSFEHSFLK